MANNPDLLPHLWQIASNKTAVKLLNIYKGLPISNDAFIQKLSENSIQVTSNKYQLFCLYFERATFIQTQSLPGIIYAQVEKLNLHSQEATLINLRYINKDIGNRTQVRVRPEEPLSVLMQLKNSSSTISVLLADLSVNGMGIFLDRNLFHPSLFYVGIPLNVVIDLPAIRTRSPQTTGLNPSSDLLTSRFSREQIRGLSHLMDDLPAPRKQPQAADRQSSTRVTANGMIKNIRPELHLNRYRIGIQLIVEESGQAAIKSYISQRQSEIIREIRMFYDLLANLKDS